MSTPSRIKLLGVASLPPQMTPALPLMRSGTPEVTLGAEQTSSPWSRSRGSKHPHRSLSRSRGSPRRKKHHHRSRSRVHTSRSRSRPRRTTSNTQRSWADRMEEPERERMDYTSKLPWEDSDTEENPKLQEVLEATKKTLEKACQMRMANPTRLQTRAPYPLPKVPATRTMTLDSYLKPEVSSSIKSDDKELGKIQAFVLDALAPLSVILEAADGDQSMTVGGVQEVAVAAVQLIGNASAKIAHLQRRKVVTHLNQALVPLVEDDSHFKDAAPSLFGMEFAKKSKGACGAGEGHGQHHKDSSSSFFQSGPLQQGGGVGGATTRGTPGAEHPTGSTGDTKGETRPEARDSGQ